MYCPGGQSRQIRSAVPVLPEGHRTQASTELSTAVPLRNVVRPPGQREHWLPAAEMSSYWPISQSWQPVAELCPLPPVCCDPAPHSMHALAPSGEGIEIAGELRLDMTTFGVEPPVVMLGLLQVRPQIRIEFEGLIAQ